MCGTRLFRSRSRSRSRYRFIFWLQLRLPGPGPELVPHIAIRHPKVYVIREINLLRSFHNASDKRHISLLTENAQLQNVNNIVLYREYCLINTSVTLRKHSSHKNIWNMNIATSISRNAFLSYFILFSISSEWETLPFSIYNIRSLMSAFVSICNIINPMTKTQFKHGMKKFLFPTFYYLIVWSNERILT